MAPLQLQIGDEINIYANKVFRRSNDNIFEAVGNTVITHKDETLYGHAASMDLKKGQVEVSGNVRYFAKDINIYGSRMAYEMKNKTLLINNARLYTQYYSIVARKIEKLSADYYEAHEAEFTTCKDCPESWTIYGDKVQYTVNQYVHVRHALLRVNGADLMYFPYIVFPVKKDRESGVLFPKVATEDSGWIFGIPFYWAINRSSDATLIPYYRTERGAGAELEYRKTINNFSQFEWSTRWYNDEVYRPLKNNEDRSDKPYIRNFNDVELHYRSSPDQFFHFRFVDMKDLDFVRDEYRYTDERIYSNDIGFDFIYSGRGPRFEWSAEVFERKNILNENPDEYANQFKLDQDNVQILPRIKLGMVPFELIKGQRSFFSRVLVGAESESTLFEQHTKKERIAYTDALGSTAYQEVLRNAARQHLKGFVTLDWFDNGIFNVSSNYEMSYQHYEFRDPNQPSFQKYSGVLRSEISFGVDRVYGLAYREKIRAGALESLEDEQGQFYIGHLKSFEQKNQGQEIEIVRNSYKHDQNFRFIHQLIPTEREFGNKTFLTQIKDPSLGAKGWFDQHDAIQSRVTELGSAEIKKGDSSNNILEFHWENSLIKKTPRRFDYNENQQYLQDNFSYSRVAHFNIKQGVRLESNDNVSDKSQKLTKLGVNLGVYAYKYIYLNATDYYNYDNSKHNLELSMTNEFNFLKVVNNFKYLEDNGDSVKKIHAFGIGLQLTDEYYFSFQRERDLGQQEDITQKIAFLYTPHSDCWAIAANIVKNSEDTRLSFDFELNFGSDLFPRNIIREI